MSAPIVFVSLLWVLVATAVAQTNIPADCPKYNTVAGMRNEPLSEGKYALPYQRPEERCRTFTVPQVDSAIEAIKSEIADPDLFRLFENTFPNTLDTTISWKGFGEEDPEEEVSAVFFSVTLAMVAQSAHRYS